MMEWKDFLRKLVKVKEISIFTQPLTRKWHIKVQSLSSLLHWPNDDVNHFFDTSEVKDVE